MSHRSAEFAARALELQREAEAEQLPQRRRLLLAAAARFSALAMPGFGFGSAEDAQD